MRVGSRGRPSLSDILRWSFSCYKARARFKIASFASGCLLGLPVDDTELDELRESRLAAVNRPISLDRSHQEGLVQLTGATVAEHSQIDTLESVQKQGEIQKQDCCK